MKDCLRCGEAFESHAKRGKVCEDCKSKSHKIIGKRLRKKDHSKPYYMRETTDKSEGLNTI